jgi:hypothetical protein
MRNVIRVQRFRTALILPAGEEPAAGLEAPTRSLALPRITGTASVAAMLLLLLLLLLQQLC